MTDTFDILRPVWPKLRTEARYGLAGEFLALVSPHTEADGPALLATFLATFGALVGAGPHALADGAQHAARVWPMIVGDTAKARKGTSWMQVRRSFMNIDRGFTTGRVMNGFGSGESLVDAVAGEEDKRLLLVEPELARVLAVQRREGSTLGALLRQAWDGGRLQVRSRSGTAVADAAHVVVVAHITKAELLAKLAESDTLGGSMNRFLVVAARRSKLLPSGGNLDDADLEPFCRKVALVAMQARTAGTVRRTPAAEDYWADYYEWLATDDPGGLLGAVIARDAAQVLRLSLIYALLDEKRCIDVPHVHAARAVWDYCRASAAAIFGERTGDLTADRILAELQATGTDGLTGTAIRDLFDRHAKKEQIERATQLLVERGYATKATKATHGRPLTVLRLATKATLATEDPEDDYAEEPPSDEDLDDWSDEYEALRRHEDDPW